MPYFTNHKNGRIDAVYSGRFAFIKPISHENIAQTFSIAVGQQRVEEPDEQISSLREEFAHSVQFSKMAIGNSLSGARWLLRQVFLYLPFKAPIRAYYKLRFIWFSSSYELLESMYKDAKRETNQASAKKQSFSTFRLVAQDLKASIIMLRHLPISTAILIISSPITIPIGIFLNRHFTVYAFAIDRNVVFEYGSTPYTTTFAEHTGFSKLMRKIVNIVQHGHMIKKRPWIIKYWVHIKFQAEKEMYKKLYELNSKNPAFPDFIIYINRISAFAINWAGCRKIRQADRIAAALRQLVESKEIDLSEVERVDGIAEWEKTLGFFYMHGN